MRIYVVGDSISIQYGPYLEAYLGDVAEFSRKGGEDEAMLNLDDPKGANGGDSSRVLAFLEAKERAGGIPADLLLVNCGLHDIKRDPQSGAMQVPPARYENNLRSICETVSRMTPQLVWIRTTPCDEAVHNREGMQFHRFAADCDAYNAIADRVMEEHGVPAVDLHTFTVNVGEDVYCDHVHFHESVREKQAAFIAGWVSGYAASRS